MRLVCGLQPVREAIRAHGKALDRVVVASGDSPQLEALARFARDNGVVVERAPMRELDRIAGGARTQGAVAYAPELAVVALEGLTLDPNAIVVALDEIEDPQNFGAILRSAVALGASAVVWPEHHSAPLSAATFRASAGAVEHATLCRVPKLPAALEDFAARGMHVVGLDAAAERTLAEHPLAGGVCLVVGAEGKGLRRSVKQACTALAKLPMRGPIASLNASVAAAIALYEVARQRGAAL
jgi:23S rRNA (guanosine2251-2'-O)-methyltransferase